MGINNYRNNDAQNRVFFKYKRAGVVLTKSEVEEIKAGRKQLRNDMKAAKAYSRKEFELTASSLGLYFDKSRFLGLLLWLFHGRALLALLGAAALLMAALYAVSRVTELRGHFTINLTDDMFEEGFELSNTSDFQNPTARLYGQPVDDAPCISITDLPENVALTEGPHNGKAYFAHTFFVAKRGEGTVDYRFTLSINSESLNCSNGAWVMLYLEDQPLLFARANTQTGEAECLPPVADNTRGYKENDIPFLHSMQEDQYELIKTTQKGSYYRLKPYAFQDNGVITSQVIEDMEQDEVDRYTVVIWLEGDDPDTTNELIGAHIGMQMDFELIDE